MKAKFEVGHCYKSNIDGCWEVIRLKDRQRMCLCLSERMANKIMAALEKDENDGLPLDMSTSNRG